MRFGEVVLKTSQYAALKSWYSDVLDTKPMFESERRGSPRAGCNEDDVHNPSLFGVPPFTEHL